MSRVLSLLLVLGLAAPSGAQPLVVTVTTRRHVYRVSQPVHFTLTETNTSEHTVQVAGGCRFYGASVSRDGVIVWVFRSPLMCATGRVPLRAGRTRRLHFYWTGRASEPGQEVTPGQYRITAGVDGLSASTPVRIRPE